MASEVQICNLALLKFGNITINGFEDGTEQANACKVLYPLMRDEMVAAHDWNFAMTRADISSQLSDTPIFEFDFAYNLPVDCLRTVEFYDSRLRRWVDCNYDHYANRYHPSQELTWAIEGNELLTNQEEDIFIRYVRRVTTTGNFHPAFVNALAVRLAAELVAKIKEDKNMRVELLTELENVVLPEAFRLNAIEGNRRRQPGEQPLHAGGYAWQTEGR